MPKKSTTSPSAAEFTALRNYLKAHGLSEAEGQIVAAVGTAVSSRKRQAIAAQLAAYLRTSPKKFA